jgi:hypothetical protein
MSAELATVSFRTESGVAEGESWTVVDSTVLSNTVPWRTFRWYKGQRDRRLRSVLHRRGAGARCWPRSCKLTIRPIPEFRRPTGTTARKTPWRSSPRYGKTAAGPSPLRLTCLIRLPPRRCSMSPRSSSARSPSWSTTRPVAGRYLRAVRNRSPGRSLQPATAAGGLSPGPGSGADGFGSPGHL